MCCIRSSLAYLHGLPIEAIVKDTPCTFHSYSLYRCSCKAPSSMAS